MSGESIYQWIAPPPVVPEKPPLYHAKAPHDAPLVGSTIIVKKAAHAHMGTDATKSTIRPDQYLRGHSKTQTINSRALPEPHHKTLSKMPPVPRRDERPNHAPPSNRDFITENAIAAILTEQKNVSKGRTAEYVKGDWLRTGTYGKVPGYLGRVKREVEAERDYILSLLDQQQMEAEEASGAHTRELSEDERAELLEALKSKWDEVNAHFQLIAHRKISTSNSTVGEIRWKEGSEAQLAQLEKDIKRLEVKAPIYIVE